MSDDLRARALADKLEKGDYLSADDPDDDMIRRTVSADDHNLIIAALRGTSAAVEAERAEVNRLRAELKQILLERIPEIHRAVEAEREAKEKWQQLAGQGVQIEHCLRGEIEALRTAVEAETERCATLEPKLLDNAPHPEDGNEEYFRGWEDAQKAYRAAIRASKA
jgi:hypothetical protein